MSTPVAHIGFNSDLNRYTSTNQEALIVDSKMPAVRRKKRVVRGRVKIKLGKRKVVSIAPSTLIGHISSTKLKAAARSVIRHQASGQRRSGGKRKKRTNRSRKRKRSSASARRKVASFII